MEKSIISWITIFFMWMFYGIYPIVSKRFNEIEITISLLLLIILTIYGFSHKEVK